MDEWGGRDTSRCACNAEMVVVLEKEGFDGTAHPYTPCWAEAGMRAAGGGSEQVSEFGTFRGAGDLERPASHPAE